MHIIIALEGPEASPAAVRITAEAMPEVRFALQWRDKQKG
jgi:hypothetical protein